MRVKAKQACCDHWAEKRGVAWLFCAQELNEEEALPYPTVGWLRRYPKPAHRQMAGNPWGWALGSWPGSFPATVLHVNKPLLRPSPRVARAEVNTSTSSGRVFAFPRPSPRFGGRAHLRSGPGLCPGFPLSRAGRQGGRRRVSSQETPRKSGLRVFPSLIEVRSAGRHGGQRELWHGDLGG